MIRAVEGGAAKAARARTALYSDGMRQVFLGCVFLRKFQTPGVQNSCAEMVRRNGAQKIIHAQT